MACFIAPVAFAVSLALLATGAQAQTQLQLVKDSLTTLRQSADALDRNDVRQAADELGRMKSSVELLNGTFQRFNVQAEAALKERTTELLSVIEQVTATYEEEQSALAEARELEGQIAGLEARQRLINDKRAELLRQMAVLHGELWTRNECAKLVFDGYFEKDECRRLVHTDMTGSRLRSDIEGNIAQRGSLDGELNESHAQLNLKRHVLSVAVSKKARLERVRERLNVKEGGLRRVVVALGNAVLFMNDMQALVDSRLDSPIDSLQARVRRLLQRAQEAGEAPAFSSYDVKKVMTLQETMETFARTLDDGTSVLLLIENGGQQTSHYACSPPPKSVNTGKIRDVRDAFMEYRAPGYDYVDVIGEARCKSPAAFYYGKVSGSYACQERCRSDADCVLWTYEDNPAWREKVNPLPAEELVKQAWIGACWGGSSALAPNWEPDPISASRSGGLYSLWPGVKVLFPERE